MSDFHMGTFPDGRRLGTPDTPRGVVGTMREGFEATPELVELLRRRRFLEGKASDFKRVGKSYVDKASGRRYRRVNLEPIACSAADVELFLNDDGTLVFLLPEGSEDKGQSTELGEMSSYSIPAPQRAESEVY